MQMRQQNLLECREIEAALADTLEYAATRVDENPWPAVDGKDVASGGPIAVRNRTSAAEDGQRESWLQDAKPSASTIA
jgi:hypothetical protein